MQEKAILFYSIDKERDDTVVTSKLSTAVLDNEFRGNTIIKAVVLPDSITDIGQFAFKGCVKLKGVTLHDSVTHIGVGAFAFCKSLDDIRLPDGLTKIDDCAFVGCALKNIILPSSLKSLGVLVFRKCLNLESVTFPDGIKYITAKQDLFQGCYNLKQISVCADCKIERGSIPDGCRVLYRPLQKSL